MERRKLFIRKIKISAVLLISVTAVLSVFSNGAVLKDGILSSLEGLAVFSSIIDFPNTGIKKMGDMYVKDVHTEYSVNEDTANDIEETYNLQEPITEAEQIESEPEKSTEESLPDEAEKKEDGEEKDTANISESKKVQPEIPYEYRGETCEEDMSNPSTAVSVGSGGVKIKNDTTLTIDEVNEILSEPFSGADVYKRQFINSCFP